MLFICFEWDSAVEIYQTNAMASAGTCALPPQERENNLVV